MPIVDNTQVVDIILYIWYIRRKYECRDDSTSVMQKLDNGGEGIWMFPPQLPPL